MALYRLSGRAKKFDGTAIDYVSIFNWADGKCIAQAKPDASGEWFCRYYNATKVGVTHVAGGCEPITHGAYDSPLDPLKYRWWRIKNISNRINLIDGERSVASIKFNNEQSVVADNPSKAFSNSSYGADYTPDKAFDGNINTLSHSFTGPSAPAETKGFNWFIGYDFDVPVKVTSVSLLPRQDMTASMGQEWQTADIEGSDDGMNWFKCGTISPNTAAMDLSLTTAPIILD